MPTLRRICETGMVAAGVAWLCAEITRHVRARRCRLQTETEQIQAWEDEGGAVPVNDEAPSVVARERRGAIS